MNSLSSAMVPRCRVAGVAPPLPPSAPIDDASCRRLYLALHEGSPESRDQLGAAERHQLFRAASRNPVAGLASLPRYDPTGEIGFCFGRAMAAHLIARTLGLKGESIEKVFIVGDLKEGDVTLWRFHTATVVRGEDGRKHVIDPILPGPLPLAKWIEQIQSLWDRNGNARIYLTPASSVLPDVRVFPAKEEERGERLIELSFDPDTKPGFRREPSLGSRVFHVSPPAAERYFLGAGNDPKTRFEFLGIAINGKRYGYNDYFPDLLRSLGRAPKARSGIRLNAVSAPATRLFGRNAGPAPVTRLFSPTLFSPKWGT